MNIDKVKTQIESVIDNVRGIPMTQAQCAELHSFFQKLIKPWEHCFTEKCPKGPDPRQKAFRSIAETIADTHSETKTISMDCYPASYVNVGWLRDTTKDLIEKREIQTTGDVISFVISAVQRVKQISVEKQDISVNDNSFYHIDFMTKDDYGRYHYGYHITIKEDLRDEKPTSVAL